MSLPTSALQLATFAGRQLALKREDLLPRGGGNKLHRYDALFENAGRIPRVVALSEPGAHSLRALLHYLAGPDDRSGVERLLLLEVGAASTPYARRLQAEYSAHPGVQVQRGPLLLQLARLWWHGLRGLVDGTRSVGVGGSVRVDPARYARLLDDAAAQLAAARVAGPFVHCLPVASGQMAAGFGLTLARPALAEHSLLGVMTGPAIARPWLRLRLRRQVRTALRPAVALDLTAAAALARRFFVATGVWLEPRHTIQLAALLEDGALPPDVTPVLWITCPQVQDWTEEVLADATSAAPQARPGGDG